MEEQMRTLVCKGCGRQIQVPRDLDEFSCVYCGKKLYLSEYVPRIAVDESDRELAEEHLFDCIRCYSGYFKNFGRKSYESSFRSYRSEIEDTFLAMDRYITAQPERREELIEGFVDRFIDEWESWHNRNGAKKKAVEKEMFDSKLVLAWYTVPALRSMEISCGEEFTELLREKFVERYPDNAFTIGSFTDINSGFRKRFLCFITTAVCESEGKPDDCEELTAFRGFRDGWLARTEEGRALTEEYYEIAPAIVQGMRYADDGPAVCAALRRDYLTPCYEALLAGDNELCKRRYVEMVQALKERYSLS